MAVMNILVKRTTNAVQCQSFCYKTQQHRQTTAGQMNMPDFIHKSYLEYIWEYKLTCDAGPWLPDPGTSCHWLMTSGCGPALSLSPGVWYTITHCSSLLLQSFHSNTTERLLHYSCAIYHHTLHTATPADTQSYIFVHHYIMIIPAVWVTNIITYSLHYSCNLIYNHTLHIFTAVV